MYLATRIDEIDYLRKDPDEAVPDKVLFHGLLAIVVPRCARVGGADEARAVDLEPSFGPQDEIVGVEPRLALVDNWAG